MDLEDDEFDNVLDDDNDGEYDALYSSGVEEMEDEMEMLNDEGRSFGFGQKIKTQLDINCQSHLKVRTGVCVKRSSRIILTRFYVGLYTRRDCFPYL